MRHDARPMGSTFIPSRCALIETRGSNYLVRGNMPLLGADLHFALEEIEKASGVSFAGKRFMEFPIIDNVGEREEFEPLCLAFGVDPAQFPASSWPWWEHHVGGNTMLGSTLATEGHTLPGSLTWRPFEGLPPNTDPKVFLHAPGWDYVGFVEHVDLVMSQAKNAVVYVHCQLGADRTGAFHIGLLLKQGLTLTEAVAKAGSYTSAGPPNADYMRLVGAYAVELGLDR